MTHVCLNLVASQIMYPFQISNMALLSVLGLLVVHGRFAVSQGFLWYLLIVNKKFFYALVEVMCGLLLEGLPS